MAHHKDKGRQPCPGSSSRDGLCGGADPENRCVRIREKQQGCDQAATICHELTHNTGPWPMGTGEEEVDMKAIEACAIEVANEK